jgi:hypothetical protein
LLEKVRGERIANFDVKVNERCTNRGKNGAEGIEDSRGAKAPRNYYLNLVIYSMLR